MKRSWIGRWILSGSAYTAARERAEAAGRAAAAAEEQLRPRLATREPEARRTGTPGAGRSLRTGGP